MTLEELTSGLVFVPFDNAAFPTFPGRDWTDAQREQYNQDTDRAISQQDLVRPGAVLRLKSGQLKVVGHVNANLGVCDDCVDFGWSDIEAIAYLYDVV